jgi:hypothetical protein
MKSVLLWVIMQWVLVISYQHFRTTYRSHPQGSRIQKKGSLDSWTLRMGPIGWPETSVRNYQYLLCNNPEEHVSLLLHSRSLKSHRRDGLLSHEAKHMLVPWLRMYVTAWLLWDGTWEGKWRRNWRMKWVFGKPRMTTELAYPAQYKHLQLTHTPQLPVFVLLVTLYELQGFIQFMERIKSGFCTCVISF